MERIYITSQFGYECVSPGDILAFSRTKEYEEDEIDSDIYYAEDSTISAYNFDKEDNDDEDDDEEITIDSDLAKYLSQMLFNGDDEETHEDIRISSVFMRVVSVIPPVKKLFRKESCHIIVELPNKKQVELNDFNGRRIGVSRLGAEVEDYIRSVHGLSSMLSIEARLESKEAGSTDSFGLELFDVKNDPSSFKQALKEELEHRKTFATDNQKEQANKQIEQVKKFFAEFLD